MHKTAEYGIAAHWKYKEGDTGTSEQEKEKDFEKKLVWLRDMLEWQKETSDAEEFIEGFKIDLFSDEVFVFQMFYLGVLLQLYVKIDTC